MPNEPEVKKTSTPPGERPATTPPQEASKVENSQKDSASDELIGKQVVGEVVQRILEKNRRAERNLEKEREDAIKAENQKFMQEQLEAIVKNPSENKIDFLVEAGELPQDKDLQLIVVNISRTLLENENLLETDTAAPVMDRWMRLLKAAEKDKSDDIRGEIQRFKKRLARKIVEVANNRGQAEDAPELKERRAKVRQLGATAWERLLANDETIDIEDKFSYIKMGVAPMAGGSGGSPGSSSSGGGASSGGSSGSSSGGGSGGSRGGRGAGSSGAGGSSGTGRSSGGPAGGSSGFGGGAPSSWKVFDESDPRFTSLPSDFKQFVRGVNADVIHSPTIIDKHYLEGLSGDLRRFGSVPTDLTNELRQNIDAKTREVRKEEQARKDAQDENQINRQVKQNFLSEIDPSAGQNRGYEQLGYDQKDTMFLNLILGNPKLAEVFIKGENFGEALHTLPGQIASAKALDIKDPENELDVNSFAYMDFGTKRGDYAGNYKIFKRYVRQVYDHLFDAAALKKLDQFRETQDMMVHRPVENKIYSNLQALSDYFSKQEHDYIVSEMVKFDYQQSYTDPVTGNRHTARPNQAHENPTIHLGEAIGIFTGRLGKEADLRAYNHDIGVVLGKKLPLKTLSEFAQALDASQVDVLFLEDKMLQTAYRFYIQELKKTSADNFWMMGTTWLSEDPQGKVAIEENVKGALKQLNLSQMKHDPALAELTDRDLNRIISMVSGMAFGITGEGFDILAQNQPPHRKGSRQNAGYFADNILPYWNMQHNFQRWGTPNHIPELMYIKIMQGGQFGKFWNYEQLKKDMNHDMNLLKTGLTWSLAEGPPMIDVASKVFGIKGLLGRGSWRFLALTSHHLVAKADPTDPERKRLLPILREPYNPAWDPKKAEDWAIHNFIGTNIDWDASFKNLEKAGAGVMLSYWIDERLKHDKEWLSHRHGGHAAGHGHGGGHGHGDDPRKEEAYKIYLEKTRGRNPLIFLRYDLSQKFQDSLRHKVLSHMPAEFARGRDNYENIKGKVDTIERNLYLVVDEITRNGRWGVAPEDWEVIAKDEDRELAKKYWAALQTEIAGTGHGTVNEIYQKFFNDDAKMYFFGSEDINFTEMAFREGGFDILKRAYGDVNHLSASVDSFFKYTEVLKAAASGRDYGKIIEAIHEICHPIESIHGPPAAEQMAYYLVTMASRFFGKKTVARLPFGIGTMVGWFGKDSLSETVFGKNAWSWDENKTSEFIQAVASHTGLIPTTSEHWYNMKNLSGEVGARNWQALYDVMRTAVPLIILLILWQAIQAETKDTGGGGGGGAGHH